MTQNSSLSDLARVLVLSEDDTVLRLAESELRKLYTVSTASSAINAIRLLAENGPFAAVLTDRGSSPSGMDSLLPELMGRYPQTALMVFDSATALTPKNATIH
jgi:DNA-binding NtrC family response regulator